MTPDRQTPPSRPGRTEPWRMERVVQRVPAHLGETSREPVSGWLVVAGLFLLILVSCGVLFIILDVPTRLRAFGIAQPTATRTPRVVTPMITTLPITLAPPSPTPGPTAATVKYKVKAGDTLSSISIKYKVSIQAIMVANSLKDETIRIGEELVIPLPTPTPAGGAMLPQPPALTTPTAITLHSSPAVGGPAATPGMTTHKIVRGDTLISIAATYGSSVDAIRIANQLDGDMLSIGQSLQIPTGAWTPTPVPTLVALVSPTPTSQFSYPAPSLMWPPDNYTLRGSKDTPTLSWIASATLKPNEFYVVHIDYTVDGIQKTPIVAQVRQGNSYKLDPANYPGSSASGTQFSWYVLIVSGPLTPTAQTRADLRGQGVASSPPSATWTFTWY